MDPRSGAKRAYTTLSCDKSEYMPMAPLHKVHVRNEFSDGIKFFYISIKFSFKKNRSEIEKSVGKYAHEPVCLYPLSKLDLKGVQIRKKY